jgi:DNA repair photolyase
MGLNKSRGDMYDWVSNTHSHLGGACPHACTYCSTKSLEKRYGLKKYTGPIRLIESEFAVNYGTGKTIFVEHCNDLFAWDVPTHLVMRVLDHCSGWPDNTYVFQTKNPARFPEFENVFPGKTLLGVTIETNRDTSAISRAPLPEDRLISIASHDRLYSPSDGGERLFLTIEPALDFDVDVMVRWIGSVTPLFVNIGADSKQHGLPEPSAEKIRALIAGITGLGIEIREKHNLGRLMK